MAIPDMHLAQKIAIGLLAWALVSGGSGCTTAQVVVTGFAMPYEELQMGPTTADRLMSKRRARASCRCVAISRCCLGTWL